MDDAIKCQIVNLELIATLRRKSRDTTSIEQGLSKVVELLTSAPASFSLSHIAHDLIKFILNLIASTADSVEELRDMTSILSSTFESTFRPQTRDVLEVLKLVRSTGRYEYLDSVCSLLNLSFSHQLGNPKNTFQGIANGVIPLLASPMPPETLARNSNAIQRLISYMFLSRANLICISGLLRGTDVSIPEGDSKRRKPTNYVSTLFESLSSPDIPSMVHLAVLREYIARMRRSDDSAEDNETVDGPVSADEFLFFKSLLGTVSGDFEKEAELWQEMSRLNMYRLRDESSVSQKQLLGEFLAAHVETTSNGDEQWRCLQIVLAVDPMSVAEEITNFTLSRMYAESLSVKAYEMIAQLVRSYSTKGLLHELIRRFVEKIFVEGDKLVLPDYTQIFHKSQIELVSSYDLVECFRIIFNSLNIETLTRHVLNLGIPLVSLDGVSRLNENMYATTIEVFESFLKRFASSSGHNVPKTLRTDFSRLILSIADGLGYIKYSQMLPRISIGDKSGMAESDCLEEALNWVASKDSSNRASALLRLSQIFGVEVSRDDLMACKNGIYEVEKFVGQNQLDFFRAQHAYGPFTNQVGEASVAGLATAPSTIPVDEGTQSYDSLMLKTRDLVTRYPRIIYTPVRLRQSDFPAEIKATELVWSNLGSDKEIVHKLVERVRDHADECALFALSLIVDEQRREKKPIREDVIGLVDSLGKFPTLARFQFLQALPPNRLVAEYLMLVAHDLIFEGSIQNVHTRDRVGVDCAYFALFSALCVGRDSCKARAPWWANRMHLIMLIVRGLLGACISGDVDSTRLASANYVVRIWKQLTDSVVTQLLYKVSKSFVIMVGEYMRLSHKIESAECAEILDRGCCALLSKLTKEEKEHCHSILGRADRESLKRVNELYERTFRYTGKV